MIETMVSRDVTDEEVLTYSRGLNDRQDPDVTYLLRKFRTNRLLSQFMRGTEQIGMSRAPLNLTT